MSNMRFKKYENPFHNILDQKEFSEKFFYSFSRVKEFLTDN